MSQDENDKAKRSPALYIPTEQDYSSPAKALSLAILWSLALVAIITILAVSF